MSPPTGRASIIISPDQPRLGEVVQLKNADNTDVRAWHWRLTAPKGSKAMLFPNPGVSSTGSFTPDVPGFYEVKLEVNGGRVVGLGDRVALYVSGAGVLPGKLRDGSENIHSIGPARAAELMVDAANQIEADADRIKGLMAEIRSLRTFDRSDLL